MKSTTFCHSDARYQRRLLSCDVDLIDANPFNARCVYDDAVVWQLSREIGSDGQLVAAIAVPSTLPGRFTLVDGHYRLRAIERAGLKDILLDVREPMSNVDLFRLSNASNVHRTPHTALDNALAWNRLLSSGTVVSQNALSALVGKSVATISKTVQLLDLPDEVLRHLHSDPDRFPLKLAYSLRLLCKAGDVALAAQLAGRATSEHLPHAEIERLLRWARMGKTERKQREESRRFDVEREGLVGVIKSWDSGRVLVDVCFARADTKTLFLDVVKSMVTFRSEVVTDKATGATSR